MGVAGSGKTTIGSKLADRLGYTFAEGDDFHSDVNRMAMRSGLPLNDDDRAPWLATIRQWMTDQAAFGLSTVVTCSALKRRYRDTLREARGNVIFAHISPPNDVTTERIEQRSGHYMPAELLQSQLMTLEPLMADEDGLTVSMVAAPETIAETIATHLG